jgi:hypothetical protein
MSHSAVIRRHIVRHAVAEVDLLSGLAMARGSAQGLVDIASAGASSILGVSAEPVSAGSEVEVLEGGSIYGLRRAVGFVDPVAVGDLLGVGAAGGFVLSNGSPPVAVVEEDEPSGSGTIAALIAPWVSSLAAARTIAYTVGPPPESGVGGVFEIELGFFPGGWMVERHSVAGGVYTHEEWSHDVEPIPAAPPDPAKIRFTSSNPDPAGTGDVIMIHVWS